MADSWRGGGVLVALWLTVLMPTVICGAAFAQAADDAASPIEFRSNLRYSDASASCTLDLAIPRTPVGRRPAVVVIHGGGWLEGDKSSFASALHGVPGNIEEFAQLGFVAATINYRMSREAPFPAALDDCRAAVRYLRNHAEEFRIDPDHVGAYGNSAGGNLALLLSLNEELDADGDDSQRPSNQFSSGVQAVASDSGPLDLTRQHQQNQLRGVIETFLGGPPQGKLVDAYRWASPAAHRSVKTPLLLIYGADDEQVDVRTADEFVTALVKAGHQDVSYIRLAKVGHCPHSLIRVPWLKPVVNEFFVRTLEQK